MSGVVSKTVTENVLIFCNISMGSLRSVAFKSKIAAPLKKVLPISPNDTSKEKEAVLKYDRHIILGRGSFAAVFSGTLDGKPVAVKRILLYNLNKHFKTREEAAMKIMDHPNVLKLKHVREDEDFK